MRSLQALLWSFCLTLSAHALPTGIWLASYEEIKVAIEVTESQFVFVRSAGDEEIGFEGPLAAASEPGVGRPGQMVVGPIAGSSDPYAVVWYFAPEGERTRFYFSPVWFATLEAAQAEEARFHIEQADPYMSEQFYTRVSGLPALPQLEQKEFVVLLEDILQVKSAAIHTDVDLMIDDLLIARGYDPLKSQKIFNQAVDAYGDDPLIKAYLLELSK